MRTGDRPIDGSRLMIKIIKGKEDKTLKSKQSERLLIRSKDFFFLFKTYGIKNMGGKYHQLRGFQGEKVFSAESRVS